MSVDKEIIKKAIAFGYSLGCRATEGGYQDDPEGEAVEQLEAFLKTLEE